MTPEQFTYWLQGFVELSGIGGAIDDKKWQIIKDHLKTVFDKRTPDRSITEPQFQPVPMPTYQPPNFPPGTVICSSQPGYGGAGC